MQKELKMPSLPSQQGTPQEPEQRKVALVVVAHPDDAEFMAAGTVAAWVADGWDVHYVICTDASGGGPDDAEDVSPQARQAVSDVRIASRKSSFLLFKQTYSQDVALASPPRLQLRSSTLEQ
jgi:GlcNAc-PI de-N-acetylase